MGKATEFGKRREGEHLAIEVMGRGSIFPSALVLIPSEFHGEPSERMMGLIALHSTQDTDEFYEMLNKISEHFIQVGRDQCRAETEGK